MISLVLRQKKDGQIEVAKVKMDKYSYDPILKEKIKSDAERFLKSKNIKVYDDMGMIELDEEEDDDF